MRGVFLDCEGPILFHPPGERGIAFGELGPEFFPKVLRIRQNHAENFSAANQAIVPAKVVVEDQIKRGGLARLQCVKREPLRLCFQATAT